MAAAISRKRIIRPKTPAELAAIEAARQRALAIAEWEAWVPEITAAIDDGMFDSLLFSLATAVLARAQVVDLSLGINPPHVNNPPAVEVKPSGVAHIATADEITDHVVDVNQLVGKYVRLKNVRPWLRGKTVLITRVNQTTVGILWADRTDNLTAARAERMTRGNMRIAIKFVDVTYDEMPPNL